MLKLNSSDELLSNGSLYIIASPKGEANNFVIVIKTEKFSREWVLL